MLHLLYEFGRLEEELNQTKVALDKRIKIEAERKADAIRLAALKANPIKVPEMTNKRRPIGLGDFKKDPIKLTDKLSILENQAKIQVKKNIQ